MNIRELFGRLRATAPSPTPPLPHSGPPAGMTIDEILAGSERVAEENAKLQARVSELESAIETAAATADDVSKLHERLAKAEAECATLRAKVAAAEGERDAIKGAHEKLRGEFELRVAQKVVELGFYDGSSKPAKPESVPVPEPTGRARTERAYTAQLAANPVGGAGQ